MPPTSRMGSCDAEREGPDALLCHCIASRGSKIDVEDTENPEEVLELRRNPSESISGKITTLNLSGQSLTSFPETEDLAGLQVLNLSNNQIPELPSSLKSARCLRVLNVSKNMLTEFPKILMEGLYILKELNLSHNAIPVLPRPVSFQHLKGLSARGCPLAEFPKWILFDLHLLETLDLSATGVFLKVNLNTLKGRQRFHQSCNNLRRVNFSNTFFYDNLVPILSQFRRLEHLDVSNYGYKFINSIAGFGDALPCSLKVLKAANVRLIDKVPLMRTHVEKVNLSRNSLVLLEEVNISTYMRFLVLNDCYLSLLPENFGDMVLLEYLNLSCNDLCSLPASFSNLTELVHLDLYKNAFREFPSEQISPLKKVTCFDMCMNPADVPSHPLGDDGPSYESLRATLRSALNLMCPRGRGKTVILDHSDSDQDDDSRSESSCHEYDSDEDFNAVNPDSSDLQPQNHTQAVPDDEEEDWDAIDSSSAIFNDATNSLEVGGLNLTADPFAEAYEEDYFQEMLRRVPHHIRNSPFFFYRQPSSVLPPPSTLETQVESAEEGQFDD